MYYVTHGGNKQTKTRKSTNCKQETKPIQKEKPIKPVIRKNLVYTSFHMYHLLDGSSGRSVRYRSGCKDANSRSSFLFLFLSSSIDACEFNFHYISTHLAKVWQKPSHKHLHKKVFLLKFAIFPFLIWYFKMCTKILWWKHDCCLHRCNSVIQNKHFLAKTPAWTGVMHNVMHCLKFEAMNLVSV